MQPPANPRHSDSIKWHSHSIPASFESGCFVVISEHLRLGLSPVLIGSLGSILSIVNFTAPKQQVILLSFRCLFSADSVPPASLTLAEPTHPSTLSISLQPQSSSFPAASYGSQYLNSQLHSASSSS